MRVIAVEGVNAVGKSHFIRELESKIREQGHTVQVLKAPDYNGLHGQDISSFLKGQSFSGDLLYPEEEVELTNELYDCIVRDFVHMDRLFKFNRQAIEAQMSADVVLLDRWSLSAQVYAFIRFADLHLSMNDSYFDLLVFGERAPDATILLKEDADVV